MLPRIGTMRLMMVATLGMAILVASFARANQQGESTKPEPAAKPRTVASAPPSATKPQPSAVQAHQGHEGHSMAGMGSPPKGVPVTGQLMTVVGEVMDPACYLEAGVKSIGPGHFQCAVDCAK